MMFERSEGVVAVAFRAMEGVAGREGPPFAFRATERDPSTHVSSDGGGGGRQGRLCLRFE